MEGWQEILKLLGFLLCLYVVGRYVTPKIRGCYN
jgi:hypothetical protein